MFIIPIIPLIALASIIDPSGGALLNKLFEDHYKRMCCIAYGVLQNSADAEDAVSIAYMNVWEHISSFEGKDAVQIKKLLTTYTINAAIDVDRNRKAKKNQTVSLSYNDLKGDEKEFEIPDEFSIDEALLKKEKIQEVARCMNMLPAVDRQILMLKYEMQYKSKQIATVMNMTVTAVDNRISRAKGKLYKMLEDYINE